VPLVKSLCLTRLAKPVAPAAAAQAAVADLHTLHSRIRVDEEEFDRAYPVEWEAPPSLRVTIAVA
jgi:hypothetical protein